MFYIKVKSYDCYSFGKENNLKVIEIFIIKLILDFKGYIDFGI